MVDQSKTRKLDIFPNELGDIHASIRVYIGNRPNFDFIDIGKEVYPLSTGEIDAIGKACGNGWRKVFNVYAKWLFSCPETIYPLAHGYKNWQDFRDRLLLQSDSNTTLIFNPPQPEQFSEAAPSELHVIMGRTYARSLNLPHSLIWLNSEFAVDVEHNLVVCPYFDYRQLSDRKIAFLIEVIVKKLQITIE